MSLFISNAYAQAAPGGAQGGGFEMLIMLGVFGLEVLALGSLFSYIAILRNPPKLFKKN